ADVLAQADEHHLEQAALDGPVEGGVRLDACDDADVVGLAGVLVEVDRVALAGRADLDDLHRRLDGRADGLLGDAVALDDLALPLGGAAAVAAHGGHEEGFGAEGLQVVGDGAEDEGDVGDAAAAGGERDGVAGLDAALQLEVGEGGADAGGDV